jgi:hypothetical protein
MLKKTIKYTDFNGNEVTEDFYFNLTKAEIAEMEVSASTLGTDGSVTGGMQKLLNDVVSSGSGERIINIFKEILSRSYGIKSEDGKRFIKSPEIFKEFTETAAYSDFFIELLSEPDAAANFINAIVPVEVPKTEAPKPIPAQDVIDKQYSAPQAPYTNQPPVN